MHSPHGVFFLPTPGAGGDLLAARVEPAGSRGGGQGTQSRLARHPSGRCPRACREEITTPAALPLISERCRVRAEPVSIFGDGSLSLRPARCDGVGMTDPGPEYWRRQAVQLPVIDALRDLIEREPDRFTGLTTAGSDHVTLHVVDPTVRQDERVIALLDDARTADIDVKFAESPRSLRELNAIADEMRQTNPFQEVGVRAAQFWIDPATAAVAIHVADSAVDALRHMFARYGGAVVVTGNGPVDLSTRLGRYSGSRDGWPVPSLAPDQAAGRVTEDVAELYRGEGFDVEIYHLGDPFMLNSDLKPGRIRLLVHEGHVVDAAQA